MPAQSLPRAASPSLASLPTSVVGAIVAEFGTLREWRAMALTDRAFYERALEAKALDTFGRASILEKIANIRLVLSMTEEGLATYTAAADAYRIAGASERANLQAGRCDRVASRRCRRPLRGVEQAHRRSRPR